MNTADTPSTEKKKFYMVVWPDPRTQNWDDANKSEDEVRFVWKFGDGRDNVSNPYKNANMKKFLAKDEWSSWAEGIKGDAAWCMSHGAFEKQGYYRVTGAMKPMKYGAGYPGKVAEIQVLEGTEQTDHQGELRLVKNERVGINEFAKDNLMVLLGDIAKVETELEAAAFYDKALDIFLEIDPPEGEQLDKDK